MNNLTDLSLIKALYETKFKKSLGQNFLCDQNVVDKICGLCDFDKSSFVLEIGSGIGALSYALCENFKNVLTVEIDSDLVKIVKNTVDKPNHQILKSDFLKCDIMEIAGNNNVDKINIAGNLPYNISTDIILKLLKNADIINSAVIMVQDDMAKRFFKGPGSKLYRKINVLLNYYCDMKYGFFVSRNSFYPAPHVDSAVIKLDFKQKRDIDKKFENEFLKFIDLAFLNRRKKFASILKDSHMFEKNPAFHFKKLGFDENIRGEALSYNDFVELFRSVLIEKRVNQN